MLFEIVAKDLPIFSNCFKNEYPILASHLNVLKQ